MEEKVTIRLIRNATLRIHYAGKEILVDPMLAGKGTLQSALGVYKTPRVHLTMPMNEIADGLDMEEVNNLGFTDEDLENIMEQNRKIKRVLHRMVLQM